MITDNETITMHAGDIRLIGYARAWAMYSSRTGRPTTAHVARLLRRFDLATLQRLCARRGVRPSYSDYAYATMAEQRRADRAERMARNGAAR